MDYGLAFRLAVERQISAYDAQYVALSSRLNATLVTNDREIATRCPDIAVLSDKVGADTEEER